MRTLWELSIEDQDSWMQLGASMLAGTSEIEERDATETEASCYHKSLGVRHVHEVDDYAARFHERVACFRRRASTACTKTRKLPTPLNT